MNPLRPRSAEWQRVCDWYRIRPGYWFRPKLYGWGATPVTWQAWASIFGLLALSIPIAILGGEHHWAYLGMLLPLVAGFVWLVRVKTDGDWRWRWGRD